MISFISKKEGMYIKRTLLILLLMLALIIFSACGDKMNDTSDSNSSSDDLIEDANTDTNIDSNTATDSQIATGSDDIQNDDIQSDTEMDTDIDTDSDGEKRPAYGNFTTLHETIPSADRMKQMQYSSSVFGKGSLYTAEQLANTRNQAKLIVSLKLVFPNASKMMDHYLKGKGEIFELDLDDFLENEVAKKNMYKDVNEALRSAENLAIPGEKISIYQKEESLHHNLTGDWRFSVGSYFASVELYDIEVKTIFGTTYYKAKLKYNVVDFYNWDPNDTNNVSISTISPADLHQLHLNGEAKEFLICGEEEYEIKWVKGVDATKINFEDD